MLDDSDDQDEGSENSGGSEAGSPKRVGKPPAKGLTGLWIHDLARSGEVRSVADSYQRGLTVRSGPRKTIYQFVWAQGGKKKRLTLGLISELSLKEARSICRAANDLVEQKLVPDEDWLRERRNPVAPTQRIARKTWTFREGRDAYLEEVARVLKPLTHDDYRKALNNPCLARLEDVAIVDITEELIGETLADYNKSVGGNPAKGIKRRLSPMFSFLVRSDNRNNSGIRTKLTIDTPPNARGKTKAKRTPHPSEVGELAAAAYSQQLGWVSYAIHLMCFTAQRKESVVTAFIEDFEDDMWLIPPMHRKTGERGQHHRMHVLPLPVEWADGLAANLRMKPNVEWMFPAYRPRKKGMPVTHLSSSSMNEVMREKGFKFSPHDIRRTFTTSMRILGYSKAQCRIILDHNEGELSTVDEHYDMYQDMLIKREMLEKWASLLVGETEITREHWDSMLARQRRGRKEKPGGN